MQLVLIRHGQSAGNVANVVQGLADYPLTEMGRVQATTLGRYFAQAGIRFGAILASPLTRARETAELIHAAQPAPLPPLEFVEGLREIDTGQASGHTFEEIAQHYGGFLGRNQDDWIDYAFAGGQSRRAYFTQVTAALDPHRHRWAEWESEIPIAFVVHAGTLRALLADLLAQPDSAQMHYHFGNCAVLELGLRRSAYGDRRAVDALTPFEVTAALLAHRERLDPGRAVAGAIDY